jgi:ABC-type branched-subunit amino acid transport system substrate-binding protein
MMRPLNKGWMNRSSRKLSRRAFTVSSALLIGMLVFGTHGCKDSNSTTGNGGTGGTGNTVAGNEILVGEFASMTGSTSTFGTATHQGIELAVDEINAAGGIQGKKIKLLMEDDRSKAEEVRPVVTKLVQQDKVIAVLGEVASTRSMNGAAVCQP